MIQSSPHFESFEPIMNDLWVVDVDDDANYDASMTMMIVSIETQSESDRVIAMIVVTLHLGILEETC